MITKIPKIKGFEYEKVSYAELENEILSMADMGWQVHDLGLCSDGVRTIYGLSYGDIYNKPVLYFQGQIHGSHEWQTAHWTLEFCKEIVQTDNRYHKEKFTNLKQKYAFYCIPCVNVNGYAQVPGKETGEYYTNANGVRIDTNFDFNWGGGNREGSAPFSEPESSAIRDVILELKPLTLFCCHTWGGHSGLGVRPQRNTKYGKLISHIAESSVISSADNPRYSGSGEINRLDIATAYNWAGTQQNLNGLPIIGCAIESGTEESDYKKAEIGMTTLFTAMLYTDRYFTKGFQ